jgi:hypothetical protein
LGDFFINPSGHPDQRGSFFSSLRIGFPLHRETVERLGRNFYCSFFPVEGRVARFFLVQLTKTVKDIPKDLKMYQTAIRYTKLLSNIPNGHKIYHHFTFQGPPKNTQIGIFGSKRNHLATLGRGRIFAAIFGAVKRGINVTVFYRAEDRLPHWQFSTPCFVTIGPIKI